jgi:hypothetical protein
VSPVDPRQHIEWVRFLRSCDALLSCLPAIDRPVTPDEMKEAIEANGDAWTAEMLDRIAWDRQTLIRLFQGAAAYGNQALECPLDDLLGEIQEEACDIGGWGALAHQVLAAREDLDTGDRELIGQALRDAAAAGARAHARIAQARQLLAQIEGRKQP